MTESCCSTAALIADGRRFRLLQKHLGDHFWSLDGPIDPGLHPVADLNRQWYRHGQRIGSPMAQPTGWPGLLHREDQAAVARAFASLGIDDGSGQRCEAFSVEYRLLSDDGTRWIRDRGIAICSDSGEIEQVIGIAEDISEQRGIENLLRDSERELRIVTSVMPIGIAHVDRQLRYRFVNNSHARQQLASVPADVVGRSLVEVLGEATLKLLQPRIDQVLAGWTVDFEIALSLPGGACQLHATLVPEYDERKQVHGFIAVTENISERKRAQLRLYEHEREFKALAENAPDVVARIDRELRYLYLNRAAESAFGVQRSQYLGQQAAEIGFPTAYTDATTPMFRAAFASVSEQSISFDTVLAGERRYFVARAVPELDRGGAPESLLLIVYDVSEQTRVQIERDLLLASEQAARAQAELATRSRDEFLAIVSHELRSPLNGIQSWTEVLQTTLGDASPLIQRAIAGIKIGVEQQVRMIDDLLDATRIITGKLSLSLGPVLLLPVLASALDSVRRKAEDKAIELIADLELEAETIDGDRDRLQQVIWNLLTNAIKFTPRGGHVWLSAMPSRNGVTIRVRDDGRGIDADFMPQLFERFQRDETGNSRGQDGFGLGLMLVRHLCELHRGSVSAASSGRGLGATFTVRLPLSERLSEPARVSRTASRPAGKRAVLQGLHGVQLLMVDDHLESRDATALLLRSAGAEVEVLDSGGAAVRRLAEPGSAPRPDLLICDIAMPDQDGYETLRQIRALERISDQPSLPAIALTALAHSDDRIRAHDAGFAMHLSKPIAIKELITTIAAFVRHRTQV